jgi:hypothetical protein
MLSHEAGKGDRIDMITIAIHVHQAQNVEQSRSETVECASRPLKSVDDIKCGHRLAFRMLGVGDRVTDNLQLWSVTMKNLRRETSTHIFEEDLKDTTGLFVDETRDTLHTTTTSEAANGGLCDTLDVVAEDFAMTLSTTLAKSLPNKLLQTPRY